jgi:hypothetical protein
MATLTLTDLPVNRALDYRALSAIRGADGAPWVFGAFQCFMPDSARIVPIVNFYQTNYNAQQMTLQFQNINVDNSAPNSTINVNAGQNGLNFNLVPTLPQP